MEFGLIGRALSHSASKSYFTAKFELLSLPHRYQIFEVAEECELGAFFAEHKHVTGFNVTIPYKKSVIAHLDAISPEAQAIGAVNCIHRQADGRLIGYNTDIFGIEESIAELLNGAEITNTLVLGSGGASQAVQYYLSMRSMPYQLLSRDPQLGNYTYDTLPREVVEQSHLIINTTPVGMFPNMDVAPALPYDYIGREHHLFDLIYNPSQTEFMARGAQRGAKTMSGERMFSVQAEAAWSIWTKTNL